MPNWRRLHYGVCALQVNPWAIRSWPMIERSPCAARQIAKDLRHLGTVVSPWRDELGRLVGQTAWSSCDGSIGVGWNWIEVFHGVFVLADPMGLVSNIDFVDEVGASLINWVAAVHLNQIAHALPWQTEVLVAMALDCAFGLPPVQGDASHSLADIGWISREGRGRALPN